MRDAGSALRYSAHHVILSKSKFTVQGTKMYMDVKRLEHKKESKRPEDYRTGAVRAASHWAGVKREAVWLDMVGRRGRTSSR